MTRDDWIELLALPAFLLAFIATDLAVVLTLDWLSSVTGAWPWFIPIGVLALAGFWIGVVIKLDL